ncbi:hypothetical protein D3C80_1648380 [compost metagenome]
MGLGQGRDHGFDARLRQGGSHHLKHGGVGFLGRHRQAHVREDRGGVRAGDHQGLLAGAGVHALQQLGDVARQHQAAIPGDLGLDVGIGGEDAVGGAESLTLHGADCGLKLPVRDVIHADLGVQHHLAGGGEIHDARSFRSA